MSFLEYLFVFTTDHNPPHFHAYYGEHEAIISIETLGVLQGFLPKRAKALVAEWVLEHREALLEDWLLAEKHFPLKKIEPLE